MRVVELPEHPGVFLGAIYRYTQIDDQLDWFDLQSNETVSAEEIKSKISIPPTLKPNYRQSRCRDFSDASKPKAS